jgi:hypothetical protein
LKVLNDETEGYNNIFQDITFILYPVLLKKNKLTFHTLDNEQTAVIPSYHDEPYASAEWLFNVPQNYWFFGLCPVLCY